MQLARPARSNTAISIIWALAPFFSCGAATPFTIAYAAYRRRSPMIAVAALFYFLSLFVLAVLTFTQGEEADLPDWAALLVVVCLFTTWIGGLIHSLAIRSMVFAPHGPRRAPYPPHGHAHPAPGRPLPPNGHTLAGHDARPQPRPYGAAPYPPAPYPPRPAPAAYGQGPGTAPHQQRPAGPPNRPRPATPPSPQRPGPAPNPHRPAMPPDSRRPGPAPNPQRQGMAPDPRHPGTPQGPQRPNTVPGALPPGTVPGRDSQQPGQRHDRTAVQGPQPGLRESSTLPTQAIGPLPAGESGQIGRYRLIGVLGQGGQGSVYLAETPDGARVAIKILHARLAAEGGAQQRFLREVEAARRVAPFSTARVVDADIADDRLFIVSEFVEGSSLEQLVRERGPRGHDGLVRLALSTAGALAAIHRAGIVHRDFKPSNVLIGADGPRVVDFGIARVLDNATATSSGVLGTPAYMSPEQVSGERVGPESDVFSWAATMVFAATGRPAFGEDNIAAVFNRIFTKQPDLSALPDSLAQVVGRCLEKRPENRPAASDVMLAIVQ